jgi:GNAT superfamily N-acetyltransferase
MSTRQIARAAIRYANDSDFEELFYFAEKCNAESGLQLPINRKNATQHIWNFLNSTFCQAILAVIDNKIVGVCLVSVSLEFHEQPFGYVSKFWVSPEARGSNASRKLMTWMLEWCDRRKCSHVFATATAELDGKNQQQFINLMKHGGFLEKGPVMCCDLGEFK